MRNGTNKRISISLELAVLALVSLVAAVVFFLVADNLTEVYIEKNFGTTEYTRKKDQEIIADLQKYVDANQLTALDSDALKKWVKKKKSIQVLRNGTLMFDSDADAVVIMAADLQSADVSDSAGADTSDSAEADTSDGAEADTPGSAETDTSGDAETDTSDSAETDTPNGAEADASDSTMPDISDSTEGNLSDGTDADSSDSEESYSVTYYDWQSYYTVNFTDGEADVFLYANYTYQMYTIALITELLLAFVLFMTCMLLGIRRTIRYIGKMKDEIEILEGGNLEYQITVQGNDELAELAERLDAMRISLKNQMEQEAAIEKSHQKLLSEMSHDLRTPLTSILIYTEILLKKKYTDENQLWEYIERIDQKAKRMKGLSNHIFEYSLVGSETEVELETAEAFQLVFYDMLSEIGGYLEQQGFRVEWNMKWSSALVRVNIDYINRVLDNLTSNIIKYADAQSPVCISCEESRGYVSLSFENLVRPQKKTGSSHIGMQNVKNMMESMNGFIKVQSTEKSYKVTLFFPIEKGK